MALRTRLALSYTAFFAAVLLLLGAGVYLAVRRVLTEEIARQLAASADLIEQDFAASDAAFEGYFTDPAFLLHTHPPRVEGLESPALYVQARTLAGASVVTSASLQHVQLPIDAATLASVRAGQVRQYTAMLGEGRVLVLAELLRDDTQPLGILQVAQPLRERDQTLLYLLGGLLAAGLAALATAARGGVWLAGSALGPVREIVATTRRIVGAEDLVRRVPVVAQDDEIGELAGTVNDLLARLQVLFEAQRRIVADVSHDLRTPLTAMRGHIEILQRGAAHDPQALADTLTDMAREVERLSRMTGNLLLLSQADAGIQLRREPVALDELVLEVVRELRPLAGDVALTPAIAEQVLVEGDRDRLKQALLNMASNALQHTPAGGSVRIELARHGGEALLSVCDTGAGVAPEQLPHLFERFYRADTARSPNTGGAGLGLAIVKWVAEAHGGRVDVVSSLGQGSTFTLGVPLPEGTIPPG
jgi:signal transduction histidine kinase